MGVFIAFTATLVLCSTAISDEVKTNVQNRLQEVDATIELLHQCFHILQNGISQCVSTEQDEPTTAAEPTMVELTTVTQPTEHTTSSTSDHTDTKAPTERPEEVTEPTEHITSSRTGHHEINTEPGTENAHTENPTEGIGTESHTETAEEEEEPPIYVVHIDRSDPSGEVVDVYAYFPRGNAQSKVLPLTDEPPTNLLGYPGEEPKWSSGRDPYFIIVDDDGDDEGPNLYIARTVSSTQKHRGPHHGRGPHRNKLGGLHHKKLGGIDDQLLHLVLWESKEDSNEEQSRNKWLMWYKNRPTENTSEPFVTEHPEVTEEPTARPEPTRPMFDPYRSPPVTAIGTHYPPPSRPTMPTGKHPTAPTREPPTTEHPKPFHPTNDSHHMPPPTEVTVEIPTTDFNDTNSTAPTTPKYTPPTHGGHHMSPPTETTVQIPTTNFDDKNSTTPATDIAVTNRPSTIDTTNPTTDMPTTDGTVTGGPATTDSINPTTDIPMTNRTTVPTTANPTTINTTNATADGPTTETTTGNSTNVDTTNPTTNRPTTESTIPPTTGNSTTVDTTNPTTDKPTTESTTPPTTGSLATTETSDLPTNSSASPSPDNVTASPGRTDNSTNPTTAMPPTTEDRHHETNYTDATTNSPTTDATTNSTERTTSGPTTDLTRNTSTTDGPPTQTVPTEGGSGDDFFPDRGDANISTNVTEHPSESSDSTVAPRNEDVAQSYLVVNIDRSTGTDVVSAYTIDDVDSQSLDGIGRNKGKGNRKHPSTIIDRDKKVTVIVVINEGDSATSLPTGDSHVPVPKTEKPEVGDEVPLFPDYDFEPKHSKEDTKDGSEMVPVRVHEVTKTVGGTYGYGEAVDDAIEFALQNLERSKRGTSHEPLVKRSAKSGDGTYDDPSTNVPTKPSQSDPDPTAQDCLKLFSSYFQQYYKRKINFVKNKQH